jgi:hypothetical protein
MVLFDGDGVSGNANGVRRTSAVMIMGDGCIIGSSGGRLVGFRRR